MDSLTVYSFEDDENGEDGFTTMDYQEAKRYAMENKYRVIANEFEWADSETVDDFTEKEEEEQDDEEEEADEYETAE